MAYRKFRADRLFDGYRFREPDAVLITDHAGRVETILPAAEAGDDVQTFSGILSPGFVNCHCHLELSHMKGLIEEGTGLADFVFRVIKERHLPEEQMLEAVKNADEAMWQSGIAAVGDICNNVLTIHQKITSSIHYHNFIEASGFLPALAVSRFERSAAIYDEYARHFSRSSIVPHAPYSVSAELWQLIINTGKGRLMTIHNQETAAEDELFKQNAGDFIQLYRNLGVDPTFFQPSGKSSLQTCLPLFHSGQQLLLVHNVFTGAEDISFAQQLQRERPVYWCLCPNANLYISGRLPQLSLFLDSPANIVLGTDSLASNHLLSILSEMKTLRNAFPAITNEQLFTWATSNGAAALQMNDELGSFETGKLPGVVLSDFDLVGSRRLL